MKDEIIQTIVDNSRQIEKKAKEDEIKIQNAVRAERSEQVYDILNAMQRLTNKLRDYSTQNDSSMREIDLIAVQDELAGMTQKVSCLN